MKSLLVPRWEYWGCLLGLLGCSQGRAMDDSSTPGGDGEDDRLEGVEGPNAEAPGSKEPLAQGWQGALSVDGIEGEAFSQIWGTSDDLWVLGGPLAPVQSASGPPILQCKPDRFAAHNIVRRNTGDGWKDVDVPARTALTSLHGSAANNVWAVGLDGAAVHFDGSDWIQHDVRAAAGLEFQEQGEACAELSLHSVFAQSPQDIWAVGYVFPSSSGPGLILHFDGQVWERQLTDAPDGFFGVWASSASDAWAVGSSGLVYHFDGTGWGRVDAKTDNYLFSVWGTSAGDVWATGNTSVTTRFDGKEWALVQPERPYASADALAGTADAGLWALTTARTAGDSMQQALVHWNGNGWGEQASVTDPAAVLGDLWVTPDGQLWGVGEQIVRFR